MAAARHAGRKLQTRRLITRYNTSIDGHSYFPYAGDGATWKDLNFDKARVDRGPSPAGNAGPYLHVPLYWGKHPHHTTHRLYPKVQPGHRIWWKETWNITGWSCDEPWLHIAYPSTPGVGHFTAHIPENADPEAEIQNRIIMQSTDDLIKAGMEHNADGNYNGDIWQHTRKRSSMLMYRWAARHVDTVVSVRAERLSSISEADCIAEGVVWNSFYGIWEVPGTRVHSELSATDCYNQLLQSLHGDRIVKDDPWLWVYEWKIEGQNGSLT